MATLAVCETRAMQPLGVHHVSINVGDVATAVEFYTTVLGLTLRTDRPDFGFGGAWLDLGDQQVHLIEGTAPDNLGQPFAIRVGDIDAAVTELKGKGIEVRGPVYVGAGRQAFFSDPAGNLVELNEPG